MADHPRAQQSLPLSPRSPAATGKPGRAEGCGEPASNCRCRSRVSTTFHSGHRVGGLATVIAGGGLRGLENFWGRGAARPPPRIPRRPWGNPHLRHATQRQLNERLTKLNRASSCSWCRHRRGEVGGSTATQTERVLGPGCGSGPRPAFPVPGRTPHLPPGNARKLPAGGSRLLVQLSLSFVA